MLCPGFLVKHARVAIVLNANKQCVAPPYLAQVISLTTSKPRPHLYVKQVMFNLHSFVCLASDK